MLVLVFAGCTKDITVDLPETPSKVVVEGSIETGNAPIILLSRTQSYFAPTNIEGLAALYITSATVIVSDGITTDTLDQVCSGQLTDEQIIAASQATGISADLLRNINICAWTDLSGDIVGVEGRRYTLEVHADGKTLTSTTKIPNGVALDSLWFKLANQRPDDDTLGYIWATLHDPDTAGNAYRWFAKRINHYADSSQKDGSFVAPFFSAFEDRYANGLTFDFSYNRGAVAYSGADDDNNEEAGYFKVGDTVVVKLGSIDLTEFNFWNSYYNNVTSQGDMFSNPANVVSNINGGLGGWIGYGIRLDTVVCVP
ncbi:MAG TPA: DUF4249 family protein [Flavobacteriales bacterium]|nr:DUF4249 family protein [Flavobacteriales bacterium]